MAQSSSETLSNQYHGLCTGHIVVEPFDSFIPLTQDVKFNVAQN